MEKWEGTHVVLCWWTSAVLSLIQRLIIPLALLEGTAWISVFFYLPVSIEVCRIARNRREMLKGYFCQQRFHSREVIVISSWLASVPSKAWYIEIMLSCCKCLMNCEFFTQYWNHPSLLTLFTKIQNQWEIKGNILYFAALQKLKQLREK